MARSPKRSDDYLRLSPNVSLKRLEQPYAYRKDTDELYELSEEALEFLALCDGTRRTSQLAPEKEFLDYCLSEGLVEESPGPGLRRPALGSCDPPSLRYLVLDVTTRCNLSCRHCYLGSARPRDLPLDAVELILTEFEELGGLRLVASGGEPLLHPDFWRINEMVSGRSFRSILSSNGWGLTAKTARALAFDNVQISLDGMEQGHDAIRGSGSFRRAVAAMEALSQAGVQSSVATMVHAANLDEFTRLSALVSRLGASSWTVDVPVPAGRLAHHPELVAPLPEAVKRVAYQFGGEMHGSAEGASCGAHLASILADGTFAKCGFYESWNAGEASRGLAVAWRALARLPVSDLKCDCDRVNECHGGCRFRAESITGDRLGPDPVRCLMYGVSVNGYEARDKDEEQPAARERRWVDEDP